MPSSGVFFRFCGPSFFIFASIPGAILNANAGLGLCIIAIVTLSVGTGFIKPNLLPLLLDQYPEDTDMVKVLPSGEKIILDREQTLSRLTNIFYFAINIGSILQIATSYCERRVGFWLAFCAYGVVHHYAAFLVYCEAKTQDQTTAERRHAKSRQDPFCSFSGNFVKRLWNGTFWDYARPSHMRAREESTSTARNRHQSHGTTSGSWTSNRPSTRARSLSTTLCSILLTVVWARSKHPYPVL